jgi:hypothetical protein
MPKISVGPDQVEISYIDSGEPSQKGIYTTLLIVHGFCWNGGEHQDDIALILT